MNDQEHKCQCSFSIRILGDGCRYCQPQEYIDRLHDSMEDMAHLEPLSDENIAHLYQQCMEAKTTHLQSYFGFARSIEKHLKGD